MHRADSQNTVLRRELNIANSRYSNLNTSKYHSSTKMTMTKVTSQSLNLQQEMKSGLTDCQIMLFYQPKDQG